MIQESTHEGFLVIKTKTWSVRSKNILRLSWQHGAISWAPEVRYFAVPLLARASVASAWSGTSVIQAGNAAIRQRLMGLGVLGAVMDSADARRAIRLRRAKPR